MLSSEDSDVDSRFDTRQLKSIFPQKVVTLKTFNYLLNFSIDNKKMVVAELCQLELSVFCYYSNVMSSKSVIKSCSEIKICGHLFVKSTRSIYNASKVQK
jgi:hypothetical protein